MEKGMQQLFYSIHGTYNPETDFVKMEESLGLPLAEFFEIDPKYLFYCEKDFIHPYKYFDGVFLFNFISIEKRHFEILYKDYFGSFKEQFKKSILAFQQVRENKDFTRLMNMVDKQVLFYVYKSLYNEIPDSMKWDAYKEAHLRAESGFDALPKEIMDDLLTHKYKLSKQRKSRVAKLRKKYGTAPFTIYHGKNGDYDVKDEISWTTNLATAKFFANRFNALGKVVSRKISTKNVIDYFEDRNEFEVIVKK